jgi:hypothetical protein
MKTLSDFLLPKLTDNTILRVTLNYLEALVHLLPNFYYEVINETVDAVKKLIGLQILVIVDTTGEYFLIVNESSSVERWVDFDDMKTFFDSRLKTLEERKRNIIVSSSYSDYEQFLIQYYVYAGKSEFKHIAALVRKIIKQVEGFRDDYLRKYGQ